MTKKPDPLAGLAEALGARPPRGLASAPDDTLDDLAQLVRDARVRQTEALRGSLDSALRIAPRPLRSVLRKVLVG